MWLEITEPWWFSTRSARPSSIAMTLLTGPINQIVLIHSCWPWKLSSKGDYLHDKGYDTDADYDLPQPLKKTAHVYAITAAAKTSFKPMGYQTSGMPTLMSTPKGRLAESPFIEWPTDVWILMTNPHLQWIPMRISLQYPWTSQYGLRNPYQKGIYAYTWLWEGQSLVTLPKYLSNNRNLYISQHP